MDQYTPLQLFKQYFNREVVDTLVRNTNAHAAKQEENGKKFKWTPLDSRKFYAFIALLVFMGMVRVPQVQDYWANDHFFGQEFCKTTMSRLDFMSVLWNIHLSDPEEDEENDRRKRANDPRYDNLHKLKPLIDQIAGSCQRLYVPRRNISIDERMVASKARIGIKQYMKDKPSKWGYKLWIAACSTTGYTWRFELYAGKRHTNTNRGLSFDVVDNLMTPVLNKGYMVYMDNFYSSPELYDYLADNGTIAVGTLRENRRGFPKNGRNALARGDPRGTIKWIRLERLLFVQWRDTKDVTVLSTLHSGTEFVHTERNSKNKNTGVHEVLNLTKPMAIKDYNTYMGGVDLSDQFISYYNVLHKTRKWYKTIFFHMVDVAVVNAWLLHKEMAGTNNQRVLNQREFRQQLAEALREEHVEAQAVRDAGHNPDVHSVAFCPVLINPDASPSKAATEGRRKCHQCKKNKTPWKCSGCDSALCVIPARNCFALFHNIM